MVEVYASGSIAGNGACQDASLIASLMMERGVGDFDSLSVEARNCLVRTIRKVVVEAVLAEMSRSAGATGFFASHSIDVEATLNSSRYEPGGIPIPDPFNHLEELDNRAWLAAYASTPTDSGERSTNAFKVVWSNQALSLFMGVWLGARVTTVDD